MIGFFEKPTEIIYIVKTTIHGYLSDVQGSFFQIGSGLFHTDTIHIGCNCLAGCLLEYPAEMAGAHMDAVSQLPNADVLGIAVFQDSHNAFETL